MDSLERIGRALAWWTISAFFAVLTWKTPALLLHINGVLTRFEGVESKANATLSNLDIGTKTWAAAAKDQTSTIQDLATDAHGTLAGANAALFTLNQSAHTLDDDLGAMHETIGSVTDLTQQADVNLRTLNGSFAALTPLIGHADATVGDLDALLKDQAIHQTLTNVADLTGNANGIAVDAKKVTDKMTADYLKPVPWYMQPIKKSSELIDIGAAVARHTP